MGDSLTRVVMLGIVAVGIWWAATTFWVHGTNGGLSKASATVSQAAAAHSLLRRRALREKRANTVVHWIRCASSNAPDQQRHPVQLPFTGGEWSWRTVLVRGRHTRLAAVVRHERGLPKLGAVGPVRKRDNGRPTVPPRWCTP